MRLVVVLSNHQYIFFCSYQVEHFIEEVFNVFTFILCHFESISAYIILNEELHQRPVLVWKPQAVLFAAPVQVSVCEVV